MQKNRDRQDFERLLEACLHRFPLGRIHLAHEAGPLDANNIQCPRFSICLWGAARYIICRDGRDADVKLSRGDVIFATTGARMEAHPESQYLSLGVVFHEGLTRFLIARKTLVAPSVGLGHWFLASHHTPSILDADGRSFCRALGHGLDRACDDPYRRTIFNVIARAAIEILHSPAPSSTITGKAFFTWGAAQQFLHDHLHEPLTRLDVANFLRLHPNHVSRLFTRFAGKSFQNYLTEMRLERAHELLARPDFNVTDVSMACGFTDPDYFSRCYRKAFGLAPSLERKARQ